MMKKHILLILVFLLMVHGVFAQKNSIKLLAVIEANKTGSVVDLDLNIIDGSGKVFIETYPLSQIDTQISLRLAKTIACQTSGKYCLNKDFMYSMITNSPVIAGPSAGAAMALLTMATLDDQKLDPSTVITGTINSGGVIGVVGGVKEKIKAAADAGLKHVLIPRGEANASDLIAYGEKLNITIMQVADLEEAYEIFTGQKITYAPLTVNSQYQKIMRDLDIEICKRSADLLKEIKNPASKKYTSYMKRGMNLTQEAANLSQQEAYYPAASRCFGANVYFREILFAQENLSKEQISDTMVSIRQELKSLEIQVNNTKLDNLGDLETAMIVRERIFDARKNLEDINKSNSLNDLAYAFERAYSAETWTKFFGFPGKSIDVSKLKESCMLKIQEVQELYNYVSLYLPTLLEETKQELTDAEGYLQTGDYALCLFKASKSKAQVDATLSALYIEDKNVNDLVTNKISAAGKAIQKQLEKGTFPILGYSYYEYAGVLNDREKYSALLYAEYGIELSNLDIYFPQNAPFELHLETRALIALILGFILGAIVVSIRRQQRRKHIILKRKR